MKLFYSVGFVLMVLAAAKAQRNVSILLVDDKNMAVKSEEVGQIKVSLCSQDGKTVIYSETFQSPTITNGLLNVELGKGLLQPFYIENVNNYFKNKAPTSDAQIMVKIEVTMKNGKILKFNNEVELNDPLPVLKVFNSQNITILPQGIHFANAGGYSDVNAKGMFIIDTLKELAESNQVGPTGLSLYVGDQQVTQFSIDGLNINLQDDQFAQFLINSGMKLQDKNSTSEWTPAGGKVINRLNGNYFDFNSEGFGLGKESSKFWYFNQTGGGFNPNQNISHLFTSNFFSIKDNSSKRETRFFYNGLSGYFDNVPRFNFGVSQSGSQVFNFYNQAGKLNFNMSPNTDGAIDMTSHNTDGAFIFRSTTLSGTNGKNPYVYITQNGGTPGAGMYYNSQNVPVIFASLKNFRMDHPEFADQDIVYASLEGPEAGAYCRGKDQLVEGKRFIRFPDHFRYVCSPDDMTIQLTPRSARSRGLAVTEITHEGFRVEELMEGHGDYEFFWEVKGVRKGFEDFKVVRSKSEIMPVPFKGAETKE